MQNRYDPDLLHKLKSRYQAEHPHEPALTPYFFINLNALSQLQETPDDRVFLQYLIYKRFSGRFSIPTISEPPAIKALRQQYADSTIPVQALVSAFRAAMIEQEKNFPVAELKKPQANHPQKQLWKAKLAEEKINFVEENISISHGGGYFHLLEFLAGDSDGYDFDHAAEGHGIYVTPPYKFQNNSYAFHDYTSDDEFYARGTPVSHFDQPVRLKAVIHSDCLFAVKNGYEAGLEQKDASKLERIQIMAVPSLIVREEKTHGVSNGTAAKINAFKKIYQALRDGQTGFWKTNFLSGKEKLSDEQLLALIKGYVKEHPNSRTAKAWQLATSHTSDCNRHNEMLFTQIYQWSFARSGFFKKSHIMMYKPTIKTSEDLNSTLKSFPRGAIPRDYINQNAANTKRRTGKICRRLGES